MIIIEGCDGTGKTTLAKKLVDKFGLIYQKSNIPTGDALQGYLDEAAKLPQNSIFDRFHLGQFVYPIVKKDGRSPLETYERQMVDRSLMSREAILILCDTNQSEVERVFDTRGEDFIDKAQAAEVRWLFNVAYDECILPFKVRYNYLTDSFDNLCDMLERHYNRLTEQGIYMSTGNLYDSEKVIIVGDEPNRNYDGGRLAFATSKGCSPYLAKVLSMTSNPSAFYLTNARKTGVRYRDLTLLSRELSTTGYRAVVAMGKVAASYLSQIGDVRFVETHHPQYWKRFKSKHTDELIKTINNVL